MSPPEPQIHTDSHSTSVHDGTTTLNGPDMILDGFKERSTLQHDAVTIGFEIYANRIILTKYKIFLLHSNEEEWAIIYECKIYYRIILLLIMATN